MRLWLRIAWGVRDCAPVHLARASMASAYKGGATYLYYVSRVSSDSGPAEDGSHGVKACTDSTFVAGETGLG